MDVLKITVSNSEHFFLKKITLISGAVVSTQLPILHLYCSTRGIWLLRFYRPKYPSTHKLTMPIILLYSSKLQRYTVAGLCGIAISVSSLFLQF